jgi:hypothetical protein
MRSGEIVSTARREFMVPKQRVVTNGHGCRSRDNDAAQLAAAGKMRMYVPAMRLRGEK